MSDGITTRRRPPAYQTYASDDLAREGYFRLTLAERGLLDAMRRGCWLDPDGSVPSDPAELAMVVRRPESEVRQALTQGVLAWFEPGDAGRLVEPDLRRQMSALMARREAQAEGAARTNEKRRKGQSPTDAASDTVTVAPTDAQSGTLLSRDEKSRNETGLQGGADSVSVEDPWVKDYARAESSLNKAPAISMKRIHA